MCSALKDSFSSRKVNRTSLYKSVSGNVPRQYRRPSRNPNVFRSAANYGILAGNINEVWHRWRSAKYSVAAP